MFNLLFNVEISSTEARKRYYGLKMMINVIDKEGFKGIDEDDMLIKIKEQTLELKKERYKLQTEKVEQNAWIREQARLEMFEEKVINTLMKLPKIEVPNYKISQNYDNKDIDAIVGFSDTHVGKEFVIEGLNGEILNQYNNDIFEKRMWNLLSKIISNLERENLKHIHLIDCGDSVDGLIHLGQLKSLRMGVVESIIYYSTFLRDWINELSKYTSIDFYTSTGNHSDLRLLTGKKGDFPHENIEKIIPWFLEQSLSCNQNIKINYSKKGLNYFNVVDFDILSTHGQNEKNLENSLKDYSHMYNANIDFLITGHKHSKFEQTIGLNKEIIQLPSVVGIDDFSMNIKKTSNPGAKMMVLEKGYGSVVDYNIKL